MGVPPETAPAWRTLSWLPVSFRDSVVSPGISEWHFLRLGPNPWLGRSGWKGRGSLPTGCRNPPSGLWARFIMVVGVRSALLADFVRHRAATFQAFAGQSCVI